MRRRRGPVPKEGGLGGRLDRAENVGQAQAAAREASDADLLAVLRDRGLPHRLTTVLVQETAHRLPSWNRRLRHELRDLVLAEAYFVYRTHPADHVEPAERAADAAALHRWAVGPVLGGTKSGSGGRNAEAAVDELAELLARFRTSPHPAAWAAFRKIVRDERSGLPGSVLRGLALGTQRPAERDRPPDPGRPPSAPPESRPAGPDRPAPPTGGPGAAAPTSHASTHPTRTGRPASTSRPPAAPGQARSAPDGSVPPGQVPPGQVPPGHVPPSRVPPSRVPPTFDPPTFAPPAPDPRAPSPDPSALSAPSKDGRVVVGVLGAVLVLLIIVIFASFLTR